MDQPKIERLLRVMQLLSGITMYSDEEIAHILGCSERTVRRYCTSLRNSHYAVVTRTFRYHRLVLANDTFPNPEQLVRFTPEEASILGRLIGCLNSDNTLKQTLLMKLSAIYDCANLSEVLVKKEMEGRVHRLQEGIKGKKQVWLRGYSSASSDARKDYLVEPYQMDVNFVTMAAYDVECGINKIFKLARVGEVELAGDWRHEKQHCYPELDAFRMGGPEPIHVRLALSWRARNLLLEEYPLAAPSVVFEDGQWYFDGEVRSMKGIGRFVMGLADEIEILEGDELRGYVHDMCSAAAEKFTAVPGSRG